MVTMDDGNAINIQDRRHFNKVMNTEILSSQINNTDLKGFYKKLIAFNHLLVTCDSVRSSKSILKDEKKAILDRLNDLVKTINTLPVDA